MALDKATKNEWIAALKSGKYKQTNGLWYHPLEKGYCCLAVLMELKGDDPSVDIGWSSRSDVVRDYGLEELHRFMEMNDDLKLSFVQIAGLLENNIVDC